MSRDLRVTFRAVIDVETTTSNNNPARAAEEMVDQFRVHFGRPAQDVKVHVQDAHSGETLWVGEVPA